jgi:hypothetical protein
MGQQLEGPGSDERLNELRGKFRRASARDAQARFWSKAGRIGLIAVVALLALLLWLLATRLG